MTEQPKPQGMVEACSARSATNRERNHGLETGLRNKSGSTRKCWCVLIQPLLFFFADKTGDIMKGVIAMIARLIIRLFKEAVYVVLTILTIIFVALASLLFKAGLTVLGLIMAGIVIWSIVTFIRVIRFKK